MAESKVVSIRIPQELLDAIDRLAAVRYPSRRGGEPNRSQLILDLIESSIQTATEDTVNNRITVSSEVIETQLDALVDEKLSPIQEKLAALESELEKLSA
jgi:metal-responsive CopG/Arc/MetJ family transcriptional regulator